MTLTAKRFTFLANRGTSRRHVVLSGRESRLTNAECLATDGSSDMRTVTVVVRLVETLCDEGIGGTALVLVVSGPNTAINDIYVDATASRGIEFVVEVEAVGIRAFGNWRRETDALEAPGRIVPMIAC